METSPNDGSPQEANGEPEVPEMDAPIPAMDGAVPDERGAAELEKFKDLAYRAAAELENYKRRAAKEREEVALFTKERLISKLIPVIDAFDLAAAAVEADVPPDMRKKYLDGFEAIGRQILAALESMGLAVIDAPKDAVFHPGEHEAVMTEDVPGLQEPLVLQVLQKGYRVDGRLIRPVRVKVGMPK